MSRDPFSDPPQDNEEKKSGWNHIDEIPMGDWKPEKRERDRSWDREHKVFTYRGVDPELHDQVLALAEELMVSASDVAEVFAQYGLACIERGDLQVQAYIKPKSRRMTLFPDGQAAWKEASWHQTPPTKKRKKNPNESNGQDRLWEKQVGYRMQPETHAALRELAKAHSVSTGEVIMLLFGHSLNAYQSGKLVLEPQPVTVKMTLK
jgi:hypothetical protein